MTYKGLLIDNQIIITCSLFWATDAKYNIFNYYVITKIYNTICKIDTSTALRGRARVLYVPLVPHLGQAGLVGHF
jgi:hypothetical protein